MINHNRTNCGLCGYQCWRPRCAANQSPIWLPRIGHSRNKRNRKQPIQQFMIANDTQILDDMNSIHFRMPLYRTERQKTNRRRSWSKTVSYSPCHSNQPNTTLHQTPDRWIFRSGGLAAASRGPGSTAATLLALFLGPATGVIGQRWLLLLLR